MSHVINPPHWPSFTGYFLQNNLMLKADEITSGMRLTAASPPVCIIQAFLKWKMFLLCKEAPGISFRSLLRKMTFHSATRTSYMQKHNGTVLIMHHNLNVKSIQCLQQKLSIDNFGIFEHALCWCSAGIISSVFIILLIGSKYSWGWLLKFLSDDDAVHPEGTMHITTKIHGNPLNS